MENNLVNVETIVTLNIAQAEKYIEERIRSRFPKQSFMQSNHFSMAISKDAFPDIINHVLVKSFAYFIYITFKFPLGVTENSGGVYHNVNRILIPRFSNEDEFITNVNVAIDILVETLKLEKDDIEKNFKKYLGFIDSIK